MLTEAVAPEGVSLHHLTGTSHQFNQHSQHDGYLVSSNIGPFNNNNMGPTHQVLNGHSVDTSGHQENPNMSNLVSMITKKNVPNQAQHTAEHHVIPGDTIRQRETCDDLKSDNVENQEPPVDLDVSISNVVCSFSLHCHLDLRKIALTAANVSYKRGQGRVEMRIRSPPVTAWIFSSGKIFQNGAKSEEAAKLGARRVARVLQKLGYNVKFRNFRVTNVMAHCSLPFGVKLGEFATNTPIIAQYEPELHPGCLVQLKEPVKASMHVFQNGRITITTASISNVQQAIEHVYSMVDPYKKPRPVDQDVAEKMKGFKKRRRPINKKARASYDCDSDDGQDLAGFIVDDDQEDSSDSLAEESDAQSTDSDSDSD